MKASYHGGRVGRGKPNHNYRDFDIAKADHIDPNRTGQNVYYDLSDGGMLPLPDDHATETDMLRAAYNDIYGAGLTAQNERYRASGHPERCRTVDDLLTGKKTMPKEIILQIGDRNDHVDGATFKEAVEAYVGRMRAFCRDRGLNVCLLNCAVHMDESTPHAHLKMTFPAADKFGNLMPRQEECFRQGDIPLPHPDAPEGRYNNRQVTFDATCRSIFERVCHDMGIMVDLERRTGRQHLKKQEYIIKSNADIVRQQQEQIQAAAAELQAVKDEIAEQERSAVQSVAGEVAQLLASARERRTLIRKRTYVKNIDDYRTARDIMDTVSDELRRLQRIPESIERRAEEISDLRNDLRDKVERQDHYIHQRATEMHERANDELYRRLREEFPEVYKKLVRGEVEQERSFDDWEFDDWESGR